MHRYVIASAPFATARVSSSVSSCATVNPTVELTDGGWTLSKASFLARGSENLQMSIGLGRKGQNWRPVQAQLLLRCLTANSSFPFASLSHIYFARSHIIVHADRKGGPVRTYPPSTPGVRRPSIGSKKQTFSKISVHLRGCAFVPFPRSLAKVEWISLVFA